MEPPSCPTEKRVVIDHSSTVDASRPFRSVKEAVAVFNERRQRGDEHDEHDEHALAIALKKIEAELEETKRELKLLKERESETEIALASLNAELHRNMSRMAQAEAAAAAKEVNTRALVVRKNRENIIEEEEEVKDPKVRTTLAEILSRGKQKGSYYRLTKKQKKMMIMKKKKPIIPLVGDLLCPRKKRS